jgi:RNA polymerase sigma factor (sigma-70 family)
MTRSDFVDLVQQLSRKLYAYAFRFLQNQEEAEDAVQEVFIKLWKLKEKLKEYTSIDALATTMTKNYCIDQLRKQKNINKEEINRHDYLTISTPSPQEQMENRESYDIIHNIINQLPVSYKVLISLKDIEGLSYEEIAYKTEQDVNTLRVTISRARKMIRDEYNKYQHEHGGIKQVDRKVL